MKDPFYIQVDDYYKVFGALDWPKLQSFLSDDFIYFTNTGLIQNKVNFVGFLSNNDFDTKQFEISNLRVINEEPSRICAVTYAISFTGYVADKSMIVKANETLILRKHANSRLIVHCHSLNF